jgi:hypothetical protein
MDAVWASLQPGHSVLPHFFSLRLFRLLLLLCSLLVFPFTTSRLFPVFLSSVLATSSSRISKLITLFNSTLILYFGLQLLSWLRTASRCLQRMEVNSTHFKQGTRRRQMVSSTMGPLPLWKTGWAPHNWHFKCVKQHNWHSKCVKQHNWHFKCVKQHN